MVSNGCLPNYTSLALSDQSEWFEEENSSQKLSTLKEKFTPWREDGIWFFKLMFHVNILQIFYCCLIVFVPFSLSLISSLSSFFCPSSFSPPSYPGLVINSCPGSTSSLPPAGGRLPHCWLGALWCNVCGAAHLSLHICLCTSPRETTLTPRSLEGYLHREGHRGHMVCPSFHDFLIAIFFKRET